MRPPKHVPGHAERAAANAEAKRKSLEKFRVAAATPPDPALLAAKAAARAEREVREREAKAARAAEREAQKQRAAELERAQAAEAEAEALQAAERAKALAAEQKAARDLRYAQRKNRKK